LAIGLTGGTGQGACPAHWSTAIDWGVPWLAPGRNAGEAVLAQLHGAGDAPGQVADHDADLAQALNARAARHHLGSGACAQPPLQFVPQSALPSGQAYEEFVFTHQAVPVRAGMHDFFNGLCWLHHPKAKRQINRMQAQAIARDGVGAARGPLRDGLTVLDENGAVFLGPPGLWQALVARDWMTAFVTMRPLWAQATLHLFGHALLEKRSQPTFCMGMLLSKQEQRWMRGWPNGWANGHRPSIGRPNLSCPCRCWVYRAGVTPTKRRLSTPTPACSGPRLNLFFLGLPAPRLDFGGVHPNIPPIGTSILGLRTQRTT
jgi:hypothetical protein